MAFGHRGHRTLAVSTVLVTGALGLAACGGDGSGGAGAPAASADPGLARLVPDAIKDEGKLVIAVDASYPPNEGIDPATRKIVGWDIELAEAVAQKLGLKAEFANTGFDTILPGIQSGRYEMGASSITDSQAREKVVDFVTYYSVGTQWAALKGNPKNVFPDSACGHRIGVQKDTVQVGDLLDRSRKCVDAGRPAVQPVVRKQQTEVNNDLIAGRTDAMLADLPAVVGAAQTTGRLGLIGQQYGSAPYGYAIGKDSGRMKEAVLGAVRALMADGTYARILKRAGMEAGAVTLPVINGAQS